MVTSQNGWPAGERSGLGIVTVIVPGTKTKLPVKSGDVATVLLWVATRWHNEIEPLVEPGNWGYAYRAVRGATSGLSNHASGTAIDLNAPAHPLGTEPGKTMTKTQVATAKRIETDSGGVVRWGGSYTGRKDPMHWEINASAGRVAALAARIRGEVPREPVLPEAPEPKPVQEDTDMKLIQSPGRGIAVVGPGYYKGVSQEALAVAVRMFGDPVSGNDREFDLARELAVGGLTVGSTAAQLSDAVAKLSGIAGADVDVEALASALAAKLPGSSESALAEAFRQVLREGVGA